MRHTTDYRLSSPPPSIGERAIVAAVYGLLGVSALLGFVIVPGGGLLALLMILAACCWVPWVLVSAARSLIKRLVVATAAVIGRRQEHEPGRVAYSNWRSSPSLRQDEPARSEV